MAILCLILNKGFELKARFCIEHCVELLLAQKKTIFTAAFEPRPPHVPLSFVEGLTVDIIYWIFNIRW